MKCWTGSCKGPLLARPRYISRRRLTAHYRRFRSVRISKCAQRTPVRVWAYANSMNGKGPQEERPPEGPSEPPEETVQMYVVNDDFTRSAGQTSSSGSPPTTLRVPHPRKRSGETSGAPVQRATPPPGDVKTSEGGEAVLPSTSRALRIDNAWTSAELKKRNRDLARSKIELRAKEKEIRELRRCLLERDQQLKYTKSEVIEARLKLQKKDRELRRAYDSLMTSATERSDLREELVNIEQDREEATAQMEIFDPCSNQRDMEQELQETREEFRKWTSDLFDLKAVMESVDEDDLDGALDDPLTESDSDVNGKDPNRFMDRFLPTPNKPGSKGEETVDHTKREIENLMGMMNDLVKLSDQLVEDAKEDEKMLESTSEE